MKSEGYVVSLDGAYAVVQLLSAGACTGCKASCADCRGITLRVYNSRNASVGDRVTVCSIGKHLPLYAALLFLLPLAAFAACYLFARFFSAGAALSCLSAALGFFLTLFAFPRILKKRGLAGQTVMLEAESPNR